jgi:hypothetical protein
LRGKVSYKASKRKKAKNTLRKRIGSLRGIKGFGVECTDGINCFDRWETFPKQNLILLTRSVLYQKKHVVELWKNEILLVLGKTSENRRIVGGP